MLPIFPIFLYSYQTAPGKRRESPWEIWMGSHPQVIVNGVSLKRSAKAQGSMELWRRSCLRCLFTMIDHDWSIYVYLYITHIIYIYMLYLYVYYMITTYIYILYYNYIYIYIYLYIIIIFNYILLYM